MKIWTISVVAAALCAVAATRAGADTLSPGEYLARAGNCVVCHSTLDGKPYAGGLKMGTPLGAIYTTNITPDKETGIGNYTLEEFDRAVRGGVARDGHRLYPAMPYPSYAKISDADIKTLFDFFMKEVTPVKQANKASEIPWLLGARWPLGIWNSLFAELKPFYAKAGFDREWNRGAYLVQGLGHCGACHTPRGIAAQEKSLDETSSSFLKGGNLDSWSASNLTGDANSGLGRWNEQDIVDFLKTGHSRFGTAFGTMIEVVNYSTQYMVDEDIRAIAKYLKSLPPAVDGGGAVYVYNNDTAEALRARRVDAPGAAYLRQCAACHSEDGRGQKMHLPPLAGNPTVLDPDPTSLINVVLNGSSRLVVGGIPDPYRMPQFRVLMKDQDIADIVTFIRASWGNKAGPVTVEQVAALRRSTDPTSDVVQILRMR